MHPDEVTAFREEDYLLLSGLQHFAFCRRQWALIHLEQQWAENLRTAEGGLLHRRVHDPAATEQRGDLLTVRGMRVASHRLGVTGSCDAVEFRRDSGGISLHGREGRWLLRPVEYKKGSPKPFDADALQLCGQALCLEEMLARSIPEGDLYYGEPRRRQVVPLTPELRERTEALLAEMHRLYAQGRTPQVRRTKSCNACSLKELCLPGLARSPGVADYLRSHLGEGGEP